MKAVDLDLARTLLDYDPDTGAFTWKSGRRAGTVWVNGYIRIHLRGQYVYAHRLAFALVHGAFPLHVNHRDDDRTNNRISNLRACVTQQRVWRARKTSSKTTSRYKGVYWSRQRAKWHARICVNRRRKHLGFFTNEAKAGAAYARAALKFAGEFARVVT